MRRGRGRGEGEARHVWIDGERGDKRSCRASRVPRRGRGATAFACLQLFIAHTSTGKRARPLDRRCLAVSRPSQPPPSLPPPVPSPPSPASALPLRFYECPRAHSQTTEFSAPPSSPPSARSACPSSSTYSSPAPCVVVSSACLCPVLSLPCRLPSPRILLCFTE